MNERKVTDEMLRAFESDMKANEKSENTIKKYMRDVRRFRTFANDRQVEKELTVEYKDYLGKTYAVASANSMIAALNSFLSFIGWKDGCLRRFKVQKKVYCSEKTHLSKAEYVSLVKAAEKRRNKRLSMLLQTICATGIRISELPFITAEAARKGEAVVRCKGKTRTVFIVSTLRVKLLRYAKERGIRSGMIFVTKSGKTLDRSDVWKEMKSVCSEAGVAPDKVFPHNLRRLFARTFYGVERDIAKLADVLGHSSIDTTRIYIVSTGDEHRRSMEKMRLII